MKLITEEIEKVKVLTEGTGSNKKFFIEGIFLQSECVNRNGRMYPFSIMEREVKRYNENYLRIGGILATHAILYVNESYKKIMSQAAKHCIIDLKQPWDLGASSVQFSQRVYTPNKPYFYQADHKQSANKWQFFTDNELEDRNSPYL